MTKDVLAVSIIDFVSIAVWVLDIILCFFTAFEDRDDKLVTLKQVYNLFIYIISL